MLQSPQQAWCCGCAFPHGCAPLWRVQGAVVAVGVHVPSVHMPGQLGLQRESWLIEGYVRVQQRLLHLLAMQSLQAHGIISS